MFDLFLVVSERLRSQYRQSMFLRLLKTDIQFLRQELENKH